MKANPRELTRRQQQWLAHLRRAEAYKMPLAQYCRAQGLSVQSLYNARYELAQQQRRSTASTKEVSVDKSICRRSGGSKSGGTRGGLPGAPEGGDDRVREPAITVVARTAGDGSTSCCALI